MPKLHLGCSGNVLGSRSADDPEKDWINIDAACDPKWFLFHGATEVVAEGYTRLFQGDMTVLPMRNGFADEIFSEHSLEHLSPVQVTRALHEWWRVMRPGGKIRIIVPDLMGIAKKLIETDGDMLWSAGGERTGDWEQGYTKLLVGIYGADWEGPLSMHKTGFTPKYLTQCLEKAKFHSIKVEPIWNHEIFSIEAVGFK